MTYLVLGICVLLDDVNLLFREGNGITRVVMIVKWNLSNHPVRHQVSDWAQLDRPSLVQEETVFPEPNPPVPQQFTQTLFPYPTIIPTTVSQTSTSPVSSKDQVDNRKEPERINQ